jgi:predicted dehydrogenase
MLRAALYGTGRWGQRLIESVQGKSERIRFAAVVTRDAARQQAFADKHGVRLTQSYEQVLADREIHAVVLATPHSQHHGQILQAARAGKHVFVEKPMTLTRATAQEAVEACRAAGVTLGLGFNRRYAPAFLELQRRLQAGEIGQLMHIEAQFSGPSGLQLKPDNWRASRAESPAGSLTPRGVHALDAMIAIGGPIRTVFAFADRQVLQVDVDDTTSCLVRFAGGTSGYLGTLHATAEFWRVHVFGSKGWLEMRSDTDLTVSTLQGPPERLSLQPVDKERAELEAFADAVAARQPSMVPPEQAVNGVAVIEAIVASAASGQPVQIAS